MRKFVKICTPKKNPPSSSNNGCTTSNPTTPSTWRLISCHFCSRRDYSMSLKHSARKQALEVTHLASRSALSRRINDKVAIRDKKFDTQRRDRSSSLKNKKNRSRIRKWWKKWRVAVLLKVPASHQFNQAGQYWAKHRNCKVVASSLYEERREVREVDGKSDGTACFH